MKRSSTFLKPLLLAAIACAFSGTMAQAIDPQRAMSQYVRDRWGPRQGFPHGSVYAITQTSDGYLWIGTEGGLVRFDGVQFRVMRQNSGSVSFGSVLGLTPDNDGSLWMRLRNMTLLKYRNEVFSNPFNSTEPAVNITAMGRTLSGGLLAAKKQAGAFTSSDGALKAVARATGVPRSPVLSVAQTGDGDVWLGMRGAGLFRLSGGKTVKVSAGLPDPKVNCLLPDGPHGLWIGTDHGVVRWDGTKLIPVAVPPVQILALVKDRDDNLWVGTDSGQILRVNAQGVASSAPAGAEPGNAVTALFEDREGNLWIGSANGIERLRDSAFVSYSVPEGVPTEGSNPIFVDESHRTWFGPSSGGLWWLREGQHGQIPDRILGGDVVYAIAGGRGDLWLGRQRGGLTRLHSGPNGFEETTYTQSDGLSQNSVYSVYQSRAGDVWAGTLSGGVSKLSHGRITNYTARDGLASNTVVSLLESADGTMWFATPSGLSSFQAGLWRTFGSGDLPSENVNCLIEDSRGMLWLGTTKGLAFRGADGRFHAPAKVPQAVHDSILGLAEDAYGSLWMTTSTRVVRVERAKLLAGHLAEADVTDFGPADGLRSLEGVKRHRSVVSDAHGSIWMSLNGGISVVDPSRLTGNLPPAVPQIQSLSVDGSPLESTGQVRVPSGRQRMVFGFAGLILSMPDRVRFRYWLEGNDPGWSEPTTERQAAYTNLGPGPYRFRVLASNLDGTWSNTEASLPFEVLPAYWQTWWFRGGLLTVFALAALGLYRLRVRQMTARLSLRFEERLAERTRIAQELHDTLLQGFLSASMQVHVATERLPADSPAKPSLKRSLALMRQVIDEGRNVVRGLRSSRSASLDLEGAFSAIRDELRAGECADDTVDFRVVSRGECLPLHPVMRDEVYRIGREALINSFRHAKAGQILLELDYTPKVLRMLVRDDGCGIEAGTLEAGRDGHWGLSGMRERADRIGARLRLCSSANAGTEVELTVPGHLAFETQPKPAPRRRSTVKEIAS